MKILVVTVDKISGFGIEEYSGFAVAEPLEAMTPNAVRFIGALPVPRASSLNTCPRYRSGLIITRKTRTLVRDQQAPQLAAGLSEDVHRSVLLLQAGPDFPDFAHLPDDIKQGNICLWNVS